MLEVANECPFTLEVPSPHVLLMELGDFAKIFRMFVWVDDYSDEWIARDWLLERTDERFKEAAHQYSVSNTNTIQDIST